MAKRAGRIAAAVAIALLANACSNRGEDPEEIARGLALYEAACVRCHGGPAGGTISQMPPVHNANGHTWHHGDCLLREIITNGIDQRPGVEDDQVMPAFADQYDERDIDALLAVMRTWWTDEQRASQAEVTERGCP